MAGREIAQSHRPALVAGDLNDVAWSHTSRLFRRIAQMLDPRVRRGIYSTFHVRYWFLCWPLDHIFIKYDDKGNNNTFLLRRLQRLRPLAPTIFRSSSLWIRRLRRARCSMRPGRTPRTAPKHATSCSVRQRPRPVDRRRVLSEERRALGADAGMRLGRFRR
jgi:hypothetical protein